MGDSAVEGGGNNRCGHYPQVEHPVRRRQDRDLARWDGASIRRQGGGPQRLDRAQGNKNRGEFSAQPGLSGRRDASARAMKRLPAENASSGGDGKPAPRSVASGPERPRGPGASWVRTAALGYGLIFLTFGVVGGWAAVAKIDRAVSAPGLVAIDTNRKTVEHLEGGIVREILVKEGEAVAERAILFRLE